MCVMCAERLTCLDQRTVLCILFSLSTFTWVLRAKLNVCMPNVFIRRAILPDPTYHFITAKGQGMSQ